MLFDFSPNDLGFSIERRSITIGDIYRTEIKRCSCAC